jgi:hypothetical protein
MKHSNPLKFNPKGGASSSSRARCLLLTGSGLTRVQLKDNTFTDPMNPLPVLTCGYQGNVNVVFGADWFNVNVTDLTVHLGAGNTGAVGIEFYSNNWGSLRGVAVDASDAGGEIGIDLGYAGLNGPCLVQACHVRGCRIGVRTSDSYVNSVILDDVSLEGQSEVGLFNQSQAVSVGLLATLQTPQAARNEGGFMALSTTEAESYPDSNVAALENLSGGGLASFGLATFGYPTAIANSSGGTPPAVGSPGRWASHPTLTLWPGTSSTWITGNIGAFPAVGRNVTTGANVRNYRLVTDPDDSAALQRAVNSGIATLYLPVGGARLQIGTTVNFNNAATKRFVGHHAAINLYGTVPPMLKIPDGTVGTSILTFDQISTTGTGILAGGSTRHLYLRDCAVDFSPGASGKVYLDNVTVGAFTISAGKSVFARQLNVEDTGTLITNNGGTLRVLGLKTEHGGTIVSNQAGATTEIIGGLVYLVDRGIGSSFPMFINNNSKLSVSITEMQFINEPYLTLVEETRAGVTKRLKRVGQPGADAVAPLTSNGQGSMIPWYVGRP